MHDGYDVEGHGSDGGIDDKTRLLGGMRVTLFFAVVLRSGKTASDMFRLVEVGESGEAEVECWWTDNLGTEITKQKSYIFQTKKLSRCVNSRFYAPAPQTGYSVSSTQASVTVKTGARHLRRISSAHVLSRGGSNG